MARVRSRGDCGYGYYYEEEGRVEPANSAAQQLVSIGRVETPTVQVAHPLQVLLTPCAAPESAPRP